MYTRRRHRSNLDSVAIGRYAGEESYTENTVSVGRKAGYSVQKQYAIAIGDRAGEEAQDLNAIAVGSQAGKESQSTMAIAIGDQAGKTSQGANAIAIGSKAGLKDQPPSSIIISTSDSEIVAKKKGLYIDPIRKFDDRAVKPSTVKEGNILSYNYKNDTDKATKEVVTGFPRLPVYPNDAEVLLAFTEANPNLPLGPDDTGTMYYDSTRKRVKVYDGTAWVALADVEDLKLLDLSPIR